MELGCHSGELRGGSAQRRGSELMGTATRSVVMCPHLVLKLLSRLKPKELCFILRELVAEGQA